jgi:hypothetical protein
LQVANTPVVVRVARDTMASLMPPDLQEALFKDFTCVRGVEVRGLSFDDYYPFGGGVELAAPPQARWLATAIENCARYGRFAAVSLGGVEWARVMTIPWCKPLYDTMRRCQAYVVPVALQDGEHVLARTTAVMGLWLEGAVAQWGATASARWYNAVGCVEPGVFGVKFDPAKIPSWVYRRMLVMPAMGGASVFMLDDPGDLWFAADKRHWDSAIRPTLAEFLDVLAIPRKDFVLKRAGAAYRMQTAGTPAEFRANLRDIDPMLDAGLMSLAAYGAEKPGQIAELVPDTGRHYLIPLVSAHASAEALGVFPVLLQPGARANTDEWRLMLDGLSAPDGEGTALTCRVGRTLFVMNTRENTQEPQTFKAPEVPSAVRAFEANKRDDGVHLTWAQREGDISFRVYRKLGGEAEFRLLADVDDPSHIDATVPADQPATYSVTALTNEKEPLEGIVHLGDSLVFSTVESRRAEQVTVSPELGYGRSTAIESLSMGGSAPAAWWPGAPFDNMTEPQRIAATAVVTRLEQWNAAMIAKNLDAVMGFYAPEYNDGSEGGLNRVRDAWSVFFNRSASVRIQYQIRRWDFAQFDASRRVDVLVYCRVVGIAMQDATGRFADVPLQLPRTADFEAWFAFGESNSEWRILKTYPLLPDLRELAEGYVKQ